MWGRWKLSGFQLHNVLYAILIFHLQSNGCLSLNQEGLALLEFRSKVEYDPHGVFQNWNPDDSDPCGWSGIHCIDGKVKMLNLSGLSLRGTLAPELGKLGHLRTLVLCQNIFSGVIPKEIGGLTMLELLDLRGNNLSGKVPVEIGQMVSLKHLWFCNNRFQGDDTSRLGKLDMVPELQSEGDPFLPRFKLQRGSLFSHEYDHGDNLQSFSEPYATQKEQHLQNSVRRRLLQETSNLPAAPVSSNPSGETVNIPSTGSGSFPAIPSANGEKKPTPVPAAPANSAPPDSATTKSPLLPLDTTTESLTSKETRFLSDILGKWAYLLVAVAVVIIVLLVVSILLIGRSRGGAPVGPWKTGLSGQLQKALISGVPKLNLAELEGACEDFSNIIRSYPEFTLYKGTLSSGVEIAVMSTTISSSKDWSKHSEMLFRRKLDTLSRISHKNFVNLLGYCEEEEPFMRMMVFEYASSGTLFEHLHVKEVDHLDWSTRMRIIMGIAYCLQYMHHELNSPVAHSNLQSTAVLLTDDYASKITEREFWKELVARGKRISGDEESDTGVPPPDTSSNVYSFGILLLEIISGKPPQTEEQGSIVNWAAECLNEKRSTSYLIDPTLKTFKNNELDIIYEVIQECVHQDLKKRPTMKEVTSKLREVLAISPDAATPRISPLWWAELEILSVEAS